MCIRDRPQAEPLGEDYPPPERRANRRPNASQASSRLAHKSRQDHDFSGEGTLLDPAESQKNITVEKGQGGSSRSDDGGQNHLEKNRPEAVDIVDHFDASKSLMT